MYRHWLSPFFPACRLWGVVFLSAVALGVASVEDGPYTHRDVGSGSPFLRFPLRSSYADRSTFHPPHNLEQQSAAVLCGSGDGPAFSEAGDGDGEGGEDSDGQGTAEDPVVSLDSWPSGETAEGGGVARSKGFDFSFSVKDSLTLLKFLLIGDAATFLATTLNYALSRQGIAIELPEWTTNCIWQHNHLHHRIRSLFTDRVTLQSTLIAPILEEVEFRFLLQEVLLRRFPRFLLSRRKKKNTSEDGEDGESSSKEERKKTRGESLWLRVGRVLFSSLLFALPHHWPPGLAVDPEDDLEGGGGGLGFLRALPEVLVPSALGLLPLPGWRRSFGGAEGDVDSSSPSSFSLMESAGGEVSGPSGSQGGVSRERVVECIFANRVLSAFVQGLVWGWAQEELGAPAWPILLHMAHNVQQRVVMAVTRAVLNLRSRGLSRKSGDGRFASSSSQLDGVDVIREDEDESALMSRGEEEQEDGGWSSSVQPSTGTPEEDAYDYDDLESPEKLFDVEEGNENSGEEPAVDWDTDAETETEVESEEDPEEGFVDYPDHEEETTKVEVEGEGLHWPSVYEEGPEEENKGI